MKEHLKKVIKEIGDKESQIKELKLKNNINKTLLEKIRHGFDHATFQIDVKDIKESGLKKKEAALDPMTFEMFGTDLDLCLEDLEGNAKMVFEYLDELKLKIRTIYDSSKIVFLYTHWSK